MHTSHFNILFLYRQCLKKDDLGKWNTSGEAIDNFGVCSCSDNVQVKENSVPVK
jgi:hypothetical protein